MKTQWKAFERQMAALIGGKRYPANTGGSVDIESELFVGQCKEVRTMSLAALSTLAEEISTVGRLGKGKLGIVCTRFKQGRGKTRAVPLVTMTSNTCHCLLQHYQKHNEEKLSCQ